jgi:L-gulonate 5-dehydrogenase
MAVARAELRGDERIAIVGAGPIGLAVTVCAAAAGHEILVSDPVAGRRALAAELGATRVVDPLAEPGAVADWSHGEGADVAFEASGTRPGLESALGAVGNGGRLVVVGVAAHDLVVPVPKVLFEGVTIVGARAGLFPEALAVVGAQREAVARFVSATYPLDDVAAAFDHAITGAAEVVKVLVTP